MVILSPFGTRVHGLLSSIKLYTLVNPIRQPMICVKRRYFFTYTLKRKA
jgi:hypothetical protein